MCNVGQVVVLGTAGKLFQFSVGQVESPAGGSFLQRFLHAAAGRYCGRQLGSIPSSHQTYRSASSSTLLEASAPLSYPVGPYKLPTERSFRKLLWKYRVNPRKNHLTMWDVTASPHTTGLTLSTTKGERCKLSIFQEVASSSQMSQQRYRKTMLFPLNKSANIATKNNKTIPALFTLFNLCDHSFVHDFF